MKNEYVISLAAEELRFVLPDGEFVDLELARGTEIDVVLNDDDVYVAVVTSISGHVDATIYDVQAILSVTGLDTQAERADYYREVDASRTKEGCASDEGSPPLGAGSLTDLINTIFNGAAK